MTQDSHNDLNTHAFVGAGMDGIATLYMFAQDYIHQYRNGADLRPSQTYLIDKTGQYGPGYPYQLDNDVCMLNQPSDEMSPFFKDPLHFQRWLHARGTPDDFVSRQLYGTYGKDLITTLIQDLKGSNIPFGIDQLQLNVGDVKHASTGYQLTDVHGTAALTVDNVVLATGHQKSPFLSDLEGQDGYVSGIISKAEIERLTTNTKSVGNVVIIGNGQSMMDVLYLLKSVSYRGLIHAVSGHGIEPWTYDADHYREQKDPYVVKYLTTEALQANKTQDISFFMDAFHNEVAYAKSGACNNTSYDIGYVLGNINFGQLHDTIYHNPDVTGLTEFRDIMVKYYGNPTAPQGRRLMDEYLQSGQLALLKGRVSRADIVSHDGAFYVHGIAQHPVEADILVNAASLSRNPFDNPLLRKARDNHLLEICLGRIKPGQQYDSGVSVVGPAAGEDKYGIRSFCEHTYKVAQTLMATHTKPPGGLSYR